MLKLLPAVLLTDHHKPAAFGRLCVETICLMVIIGQKFQPPSGGCVLKPVGRNTLGRSSSAAAFGRLCVETALSASARALVSAAAFGRLCVETLSKRTTKRKCSQPPSGGCVLKRFATPSACIFANQPPSGGCVLKLVNQDAQAYSFPAAFGRLCVETSHGCPQHKPNASRLRAAVC